MNTKLLWLAIIGLTILSIFNSVETPEPKPEGFLSAPAGTWVKPDGTKAAVVMLFYSDGTIGWSAQPIVEEKPVMQLGK